MTNTTDHSRNKVLMIAHYFPPGASSGTMRTVKFAKYLPDWNWEPVVLTMETKALLATRIDPTLLREISPDLKVYRTPVWAIDRFLAELKRKALSFFKRSRQFPADNPKAPSWSSVRRRRPIADDIRDWLQFPDTYGGWLVPGLWNGYRVMKRHQIDLIYSTAPSPVSHMIAMGLKKLTGRPWVADFRDPWECLFPECVYDEEVNVWKHRAEIAVAEKVIAKADLVIANTDLACQAFRERFPALPAEKFITIPNGFDPQDFVTVTPSQKAGTRLTFTHAGTFFRGLRTPDEVLRAVTELVSEGRIDPQRMLIKFVGCGSYPQETPAWLEVIPRVSHHDSLKIMAESDVLILLQQSEKYRLMIPAKFYEYMAVKKWILGVTPDGATSSLLNRLQNGLLANPNRIVELKAAILHLYERFITGTLYPVPFDADIATQFTRQSQTQDLASRFGNILSTRAVSRERGGITVQHEGD